MNPGLMPLFFLMLMAGASCWAIMPGLSTDSPVASCVPSEPPPQDEDEQDGDEDDQSPRQPTT